VLERAAREAAVDAMRDFPQLRQLGLALLLEVRIDEAVTRLEGAQSMRRSLERWRQSFGRWGRGVRHPEEHGDFFSGRIHALRTVVSWLADPRHDDNLLVVTGSAGTGKSALIARVVALADIELRDSLDLKSAPAETTPEAGAIDVELAVLSNTSR
jgi:hypothetical protein